MFCQLQALPEFVLCTCLCLTVHIKERFLGVAGWHDFQFNLPLTDVVGAVCFACRQLEACLTNEMFFLRTAISTCFIVCALV
jgi:hypothetical protein